MKTYRYTGEVREALILLREHYAEALRTDEGEVPETISSISPCPLCKAVNNACPDCPWMIETGGICTERITSLLDKHKKWRDEYEEIARTNPLVVPSPTVSLRNHSKRWAKMRLKEIDEWLSYVKASLKNEKSKD